MLVLFARTLILYGLVVLVMRLMGKRQIGQLQPFELVVMIMLAELASVPMQNRDLPLITGVVPIATLLLAQVSLSLLTLHSQWARRIICGTPSILVRNGRLCAEELTRLRVNLNDLLEQLRAKNIPNLADVEFAIMETTGHLSVLPKSQKRPLSPADLKLSTEYEGLPLDLIIDGQINRDNLKTAGLDEAWLRERLAGFGLSQPSQVFFASLDSQGQLYLAKKE